MSNGKTTHVARGTTFGDVSNQAVTLNYDKILSATVDGEKIKYGILFGNEKIVFIKVGADGNIRGYQDKYLKMAHRIHARIGATVI